MITSLRATLIAFVSLSLTSFTLANDTQSMRLVDDESAQQTEITDTTDTPLEQAAEGIEIVVPLVEETPADVQLPVDLKSAADIALAAFGGEVLKAEHAEDEAGLHFLIRIVNNGRVRDVVIDAANGEIVRPIETEVVETPAGELAK